MKKFISSYVIVLSFLIALFTFDSVHSASGCLNTLPICSPDFGCTLTYDPSDENQAWVKDSLSCGFSCGSGYSGSDCVTPISFPITGFFDTPVVSSGAYTWNLTLTLSQSGTLLNLEDLQYWTGAFTAVSSTSIDDTIVITLEPVSPPLSVPCSTYTLNVPSSHIQGNDGFSANPSSILASFSVVGCPVEDTVLPTISISGYTLDSSGTYLNMGSIGDNPVNVSLFPFLAVCTVFALLALSFRK